MFSVGAAARGPEDRQARPGQPAQAQGALGGLSLPVTGALPSSCSQVAAALAECRRAFRSVAVFSGAVNVLMLAGPLYMLQVYDRVLASRSVPTLDRAYGFSGRGLCLSGRARSSIRSRVVVRVASLLDRHLGTLVHTAVVRLGSRRAAGRRSAPAGARSRPNPRVSQRKRTGRIGRPALDAGVSLDLLSCPPLARGAVARGGHHPHRSDRPDRSGQSRAESGSRARSAAFGSRSLRPYPAKQRNSARHGHGGRSRQALGARQPQLSRGRRSSRGHGERLWKRHEDFAAAAAIRYSRARRLSRDPQRANRRRDDRRLHHDGPRARADRRRDRQLARF